jgi:hypothetical protein
MNTNIETTNTGQEAFILHNPQEMDTKASEEDNSKPDGVFIPEDKDKFQELFLL